MAFKGKRFMIFGAFSSKEKAKRAERKGKGRFILKRKVRGKTRYVVLKEIKK